MGESMEEDPCTRSGQAEFAENARQLLNHRLRVIVKDGRVLVGEFCCIDMQGTLVLANTRQCSDADGPSGMAIMEDMQMGMVLVPKLQRVSCEVEVMPMEVESVRQLLAKASLRPR